MPDPARHPRPSAAAEAAIAHRLPKVLLHEHLDGGLRVATLFDLLRERGLAAPAGDVPALAAWFEARAHAGSLVEYLRGFALTVAAMATPEAMARVAFEAAEDARADGCVLAEFRIAPLLFEPFGVSGEAAVEALLAGLARSPLPSGLIVCAMRHLPTDEVGRSAALALRYQGRGVVGFDLAGAEAGHPATDHAAVLRRVQDGGLPLTLHAGEADAGGRVLEAARLGARRIGHGVRLADLLDGPGDPAPLLAELAERRVHLEVCPTSNVHTGAAPSLAAHPIRSLARHGVSLSFHTDNRLMSCVDMSTEALQLHREAGFGWADLQRMGLAAAEASFLPEPVRVRARDALLAFDPADATA
ncbi:adenosine deaminase family protein [Ideonella sp. A 288]|uniref:adenosine deaminase family protein n=1 Tax=Ideonella sp. A 288 TaxID=1962181 RepID=UPI000B4BF6E0|nr:adenosine deaminase family protein [Ideonella sp. A 288]